MRIHEGSQGGRDGALRGVAAATAVRRPYHLLLLVAFFIASCAAPDTRHQIVISTREQKLAVLDRGNLMAIYSVSTSKFGLGDWRGSRFTPLGQLQIAEKIGGDAPPGAVFKDRRRTGEIVPPDSPGRDPIVTRILWLRGLEAQNSNAFTRDIYIHGTPEERLIGTPASYGCIRMRSSDIISLYGIVGVGAVVSIVNTSLASAIPGFVTPGTLAIR
ncbi:MAG: murein L,D-transpeptidase [Verrucomicrobia bacterium]|nr:MAG: murein L,D-transpeptidase [Verrucomicrobiota bacterium]PYK05083.1 MAG: murein L,D-transpeptidase [Verrucomicrobiota bacterium]